MTETWKVIKRAPSYEISSFGRVRRVDNGVLLTIGHHKGRLRVHLYSENDDFHVYLHRLVAEAFIPGFKPDDGLIFIDGDLKNASVDNLKVKDRATGRINKRLPKNVYVEIIETGDIYPSVSMAARAINGQCGNVLRVLNGEFSQHKGFTFRLVKVDSRDKWQ